MIFLNAIQWPAMLVTVVAAWLVARKRRSKDLGILVISPQQCVVDHLESAKWSVCADRFAGLSCFLEYQANREE